jgi:hypothetical protein
MHWKDPVAMALNLFDTPVSTTTPSGAYSVESFSKSFFLEFDFTAQASGACVVGFSTTNPDADRSSIEYGIEVGTPAFTGLGAKSYRVYESGSLVFTQTDAGLTSSDRFRIAFENGTVKYYRNGALFYTSAASPDITKRWHVDLAIETTPEGVNNVFAGSIGTRGEGWRISPDGLAELSRGVLIAGTPIDAVRARSINAIDQNNRYRGNDFGPPLENRISASMIRMSSGLFFREDCTAELFLDIPDSVLLDSYANFDSVKLARVRVYNIFGEVVKETESVFGGRGIVPVGIFPRDFAEIFSAAVAPAVFSIEIRNGFGWSKPIYWTHDTSVFWTTYSWSGNGTTAPPTWVKKTDFPLNLTVTAISPTSARMDWVAASTSTINNSAHSVFVLPYRQRPPQGPAVASSTVSAGAGTFTFTGLSPDTEYLFLVRQAGNSTFGQFVYVRMPSSALSATRPAPTGLTVVATSNTTVTLNWTRNATDNNNVEVWQNGSLLSTESATVITKNISSLTAGNTYVFKVRNKWSSGTTFSDFSNEYSITLPVNPTPTSNDPTSLTAILTGNGNQVILNWVRNGGSNGRVERSSNGTSYSTIVSSLGTTETYTDIPGFSRHVWYRVFNATGGVNYSNVIDLFTSAPPDSDPVCVTPDTMIAVFSENVGFWKEARLIQIGDALINKLNQTSVVTAIMRGQTSRLYAIATENDKQLWCSPSHPIIQSLEDCKGKCARLYKLGDSILTYHEGEIVQSTVAAIEIIETPEMADVVIFQLEGEHSFVTAGIVSHNLKPNQA